MALKAFTAAKDALANATLLSHPVLNAPTSLMTDASDIAVGAVVQQFIDDEWCPIVYFSRKLKSVEMRYSTFDQELLAIYLSIQHFRHILEGRQFYVFTDHRLLTHSLSSSPNRHFPRQIQHLDFISQFTSDIHHIQGSNNQAANAYCEYKQSPRIPLRLSTSSSCRSLNMTTLSCLSYELLQILWTSGTFLFQFLEPCWPVTCLLAS